MSQATRAAYAAARASHAFDEVRLQFARAFLQKRDFALLDSVAGAGFKHEFEILFSDSLRNSVGKSSAAREDSAEVRRVVENVLVERGYVYIFAVEKSLKFLER